MRIVYAGAYLPWPLNTGGRIRSYHLLERLAASNEVHLVAPDERRAGDLPAELVRLCASVVVVPAPHRRDGLRGRLERLVRSPEDIVISRRSVALEAELRRLVTDIRCDLVFLDDLGAVRYLAPSGRAPTVLSKHNVERRLLERIAANKHGRAARALGRMEAAVVRRQEARAAEMADAVIVPSAEDRAALAEQAPNVGACVVPNGVDTLRIRPQPRSTSDDHTLLFVGALFWYPNVEGLTWFVRDVLPLVRREAPDARLLVVGSDPAPSARALPTRPGVEWFGAVEDVGPFLARAGCCVVPLLSGSGTRLKVLEALAAGRAVVSTTIGVEGLGLRPNDECLIADSPGEFAAAIIRVLTDRALREALQRAGRLAAETRFAWPIALRDLNAICREAARAMRILFVSCLLPHPSVAHGGGTDLYHLIESLGGRHEVHLVSIASEDKLPHVEEIRPYCASLRTVTPAWTLPQKWRSLRRGLLTDPLHLGRRAQNEMRAHIRQVVDGGIEVVQFAWTETARYRNAVPAGRAATVLDEVDVSFRPREYRARRMAPGIPRLWARAQAARARRAELGACARFDLVLARSECDRQALLRLRPGLNVEIHQPWTHVEEFSGIGAEARDPGRLLFVGAMDRDENCQAVEYFCHEILPHVRTACPDARLEIVGASPQARVQRLAAVPGVEVTGYVADLREAYAHCDVVVAPVQLPGGVFNKVVDGMAAGRPVVTTSLGNEGIAGPVGDAVLIGDAPLAFAKRVVELVRDRTLWQQIAQGGRRHVQAKYRWDDDVAHLEELYRRLGADRGAGEC